MYNGGYDDMVLAKTQIRQRMESDNAVREKKIAQLNEFIARFSAGTRSAQATSRKKKSSACKPVNWPGPTFSAPTSASTSTSSPAVYRSKSSASRSPTTT
jgi:ATPase subunit of ABC transporter with duplicated ATPase domains